MRLTTEQAAARLAEIDASDPEMAHIRADAVLLATVDTAVEDAYEALAGRCAWWAAA